MKLSVITVNYNNATGLQRTCDSILKQSCLEFEHIIVDGGSIDGSLDIVKGYLSSITNHRFPINVRWVSEKDKGIYNAMNKGIRMASGDYLLFLNSADSFYTDDVVSQFLNASVHADVVAACEINTHGELYIPPTPEQLTCDFLMDWTLMHQSTFIRRDVFEKYGYYSEDLRMVSDWEWFLKALIQNNASYETVDFVCALFDLSGVSNTNAYLNLSQKEKSIVYNRVLPRYRPTHLELLELRHVRDKYNNLMNGKIGVLIKIIRLLKRFFM